MNEEGISNLLSKHLQVRSIPHFILFLILMVNCKDSDTPTVTEPQGRLLSKRTIFNPDGEEVYIESFIWKGSQLVSKYTRWAWNDDYCLDKYFYDSQGKLELRESTCTQYPELKMKRIIKRGQILDTMISINLLSGDTASIYVKLGKEYGKDSILYVGRVPGSNCGDIITALLFDSSGNHTQTRIYDLCSLEVIYHTVGEPLNPHYALNHSLFLPELSRSLHLQDSVVRFGTFVELRNEVLSFTLDSRGYPTEIFLKDDVSNSYKETFEYLN
jgi:hypothetical protein